MSVCAHVFVKMYLHAGTYMTDSVAQLFWIIVPRQMFCSIPHTVVCSPQCANGTGVCVANNTCSCAPGYLGDTCSEQGTYIVPFTVKDNYN